MTNKGWLRDAEYILLAARTGLGGHLGSPWGVILEPWGFIWDRWGVILEPLEAHFGTSGNQSFSDFLEIIKKTSVLQRCRSKLSKNVESLDKTKEKQHL